jgi:hypothetical protein
MPHGSMNIKRGTGIAAAAESFSSDDVVFGRQWARRPHCCGFNPSKLSRDREV